MLITRTIIIDGKDPSEFANIKAHLEQLKADYEGWTISYDTILNRAIAVKREEVDKL